jgi:transcriptional regulator of acetoin/glycerol metabolism
MAAVAPTHTFVEWQTEQMRLAMVAALEKHGTVRGAANELGMSKSTFFDRARELGISTKARRKVTP